MKIIANLNRLLIACSMVFLTACGGGASDDIDSGQVLLACSVPQIPNEAGTEYIDPPPNSCKGNSVPEENKER